MASAGTPALSLDQMKQNQRARIATIGGDAGLSQRLMEMGLLEGEEIEVVGFAPLGDPMEILIRGYRLSLRRREAACIGVEALAP